MPTIVPTSETRSPLIFNEEYLRYSREIIYKLHTDYGEFHVSKYQLVNHNAYRHTHSKISSSFMPYDDFTSLECCHDYAYGLLFNAYNSNVVVLDFDSCAHEQLMSAQNIIMSELDVKCIDIAISSTHSFGTTNNIHLYAGLDSRKDLISFYKMGLKGSCSSFNKIISDSGKIIIRVSNKFINKQPIESTTIKWISGLTRIQGDTWTQYTSEQLIVPLISADAPCLSIPKKLSRSLRLRG